MGFLSNIFSKKKMQVDGLKVLRKSIVVDGEEIELNDEAIEFIDIYEQNIEAARCGDSDAEMLVGKILYEYAGGFWFAMNRIDEAVGWLEKAAEKGYGAAYTYLGKYYSNDRYKKYDYTKSFDLYYKAAELGDAEGYCCIGMAYENGKGIDEDIYEAVDYFLRAADMGNTYSMEKVGIAYYVGSVIEEDKEKAFEYLSKAYLYGDDYHTGQFYYCLANCYLKGEGTDKQPERAVKILKEECENHELLCDSKVRNLLIYCYENGIGTPVDFGKAGELRRKEKETYGFFADYISALVGKE